MDPQIASEIEAAQSAMYHQLRSELDLVASRTGLILDLAVWADTKPSDQHELMTQKVRTSDGVERDVKLWFLVRDAATSVILLRPLALFAAARIGEQQQPSA